MKRVVQVMEPDVATMKNLRLVCKLWYETTLRRWRSIAVPTIVQVDHEGRLQELRQWLHRPHYRREYEFLRGLSLAEYERKIFHPHKDILDLAKVPYSRICLKNWTCISTCNFGGSERFWQHISQNVTYLRLKDCEFRCKEYHKNPGTITLFLSLLFEKTPRLEQLIMSGCTFPAATYTSVPIEVLQFRYGFRNNQSNFGRMDRGSCFKVAGYGNGQNLENLKILEVDGELPIYWEELLKYTPNLKRLRSINDGSGDYNCLATAIRNLRQEEGNANRLKITHLDVLHTSAFYLDPICVNILAECELPLESLAIRLGSFGGVISQLDFEEMLPPIALATRQVLLESHRGTLKKLKIFRERGQKGPPKLFEFGTILPNLVELHLYGEVSTSFRFLLDTPNLKRLVINRYCVENLEPMFSSVARYSKRSSQFAMDKMESTGNALDHVIMDKLEYLHMDSQPSEQSLKKLARWMPNLKVLKMIINNVTLLLVGQLWPGLQELMLLPGSMPSSNSICRVTNNFKNLKRFELLTCCGTENCGSHLGDRAVLEGFCKMPKLAILNICVSQEVRTLIYF